MSILILTTGGTIGALPYEDPTNPPAVAIMPSDGRDLVAEALSDKSFAFAASRTVSLEPRDSQLIDEPYRRNMLRLATEAREKEILITHGTDRILGTASYFYQQFKHNTQLNGKIVMLTGAMTPLSNGSDSDGHLNLEFSLKQLARLGATTTEGEKRANSGVYIVLCDHDGAGEWKPQLYRYEPGKYEKVYTPDGRYNRLQKIANPPRPT